MRHLVALIPLILSAVPAVAQDTTVVRSNGAGVWRNPRLVEELRIGVLEGDDRYVFGSVSRVEEVADGSIWIVDSQGPRVRIYDRSGRYVRDVARRGAGPGDIASVFGIDRTPDGRVAVWDLRNQRVSLHRPDGTWVTSFAANSSSAADENFRVDTAGRYWVSMNVFAPACVHRVPTADGSVEEIKSEEPGCYRPAFLRFSPAGALVDTVLVPIPQQTERVPGFVIVLPEGEAVPFTPEWDYAVSPLGHFVIAHSMRYAFTIAPAPGGAIGQPRLTRIERAHETVRLSRGERDDWQARADFYTRRYPRSVSSGVQVPEVKPPIRGVSVDRDGRIWVDRYVAAEKRTDIDPTPARSDRPPPLTWREPRTFDVFEPSGRFLGTVVAPRGARLVWQRGSTVWAVVRGDMDENYVVRYRLVTN